MARLPLVRGLDERARDVVVKQDGVATTAQLAAWGVGRSVVAHRVARGDWQRVHRGVVVLHPGPTSWRQRARAALLYAGPDAALSHESAAYLHGVLADPGPRIVVTVPHRRTVVAQRGLVVHRARTMPWSGGRLRSVDAAECVLELLDARSRVAGSRAAPGRTTGSAHVDAVVGLLCDAVRAGVAPETLLLRAERRCRLAGRRLLVDMLGQVQDGIESPLEHRYARDVERRHGLPRAVAQRWERVGGRWIRADRVYPGHRLRTELDGRLAHPSGSTDADVWRDNAVLLATGDLTLRYRWRHVAVTPCETAAQVAAALHARGWRGTPRRCSPACPVRP